MLRSLLTIPSTLASILKGKVVASNVADARNSDEAHVDFLTKAPKQWTAETPHHGIEADNAPVHCLVHQHVQPEKAMVHVAVDASLVSFQE